MTLVPAWCTQYGHASPGKVTPELPTPRAMAVPILLCCCSGTIPPSPLLTHLRDQWDEALKTATTISNHNLWGQSKRGGTPVFKSYHKGTEIGECHIPERNKRAPECPPALGGEVDVPVEGMHPLKLHDRTTPHLKLP